jgi:hypothetical protein
MWTNQFDVATDTELDFPPVYSTGSWEFASPLTIVAKNIGPNVVFYSNEEVGPGSFGYPLDPGKEVTLHLPGGRYGQGLRWIAIGGGSRIALRVTFNRGDS